MANGFTGNADNVWHPEYKLKASDKSMAFQEGAELWQVGPDGPQLVATWSEKAEAWIAGVGA